MPSAWDSAWHIASAIIAVFAVVLGLKIMGKDMLRLSVSPSANQLQDRTVLIPTTRAKYFCSFSPKKKMSS